MAEITIDPEFRDWIIPLSPEEQEALEASIIEDGCRDPLVVWKGIIVDGHHRYSICTKHSISFRVVEKEFQDRDAVKLWMVKNQIARRNLDPIQRIALVMKGEELIAERAKEKQISTLKQGDEMPVPVNLPKRDPIDTRKEMATMAKVSERTYDKGKEILKKADPEVVAKVMAGEVSIHKAFTDMKREEKKEERHKELIENPPIPDGKYDVVYADPPWRYEFSETQRREIENQYPTMDLEDIKALQLPTEENAVLLLWTTAPKLEEALQVLNAWGFTYRTCAIWDKEKMGMGYWFRIQHEILLVGIKGEFRAPEPEDRISSIIRAARGEHSKKPEIMYEVIEKMFPGKKYLEAFSRSNRNGWTTWGNQPV